MFDPDGLPEVAARLWEAAAVSTGGRHSVEISVGPDHLSITRLTLLEALLADETSTRDEIEAWVIATAQRLGFEHTELTDNGTFTNPGRVAIRIPIHGFTVSIQGICDASSDSQGDVPAIGLSHTASKRPDLTLV